MEITMTTPNRQRLIRLIHVAKRDLSMDDDTYRAILQRIGKKASSADLTIPELEKVLEHLKRSGFKVRSKAKPAQAKPSRPLAQDGESKKIRALWLFLHELGAVKNPSEEALATYVKRIAGVDALQWVSGEQAERLIETMKKWAMRRALPAAVAALRQEVIAEHRAAPLSPAKADLAMQAQAYLNRGQGFDMHWWAWERLMGVLDRSVSADLAALKPAGGNDGH